ncbi:MAG: alpha/beta hydrolase [Alphaproteobacteria bacterium]|nr:alpha/beta hydrolase [Alphaproteobacteria bacterium]
MEFYTSGNIKLAYKNHKLQKEEPVIIWAHGWGQDHKAFLQIMESLKSLGNHYMLDFPGFGESSQPPEDWDVQSYADFVAKWLESMNFPPVIWIGHSFGCRVGIRIATKYPDKIQKLILISGAGLKRKRPLHKEIYFYCRIKLFKFLKKFVPEGAFKEKLMARFGSTDYKNAGPIRKVFVRTVNEDLSKLAQNVICPTTLIYGTNDTETPPEFGERYSRLIEDSKLFLLDGQDHYSVLSEGRHQVIKIIADTVKE